MLRSSLHSSLLCIATFLTACGGTVSNGSGGESTGGSGGAGAGGQSAGGSGAGGQSAGGANTGGQSPDCPPDEPVNGTPCDLDPSVTCFYGDMCCPNEYGCFNGVWSQYDVDCVAPASCPEQPPEAGSACGGPCLQFSPCGYACNGGISVLAACPGDTWQLTSSECSADIVPCGDESCPAGQICVETAGGPGISYTCADNPCAPGPLSCECAGSICGGSPFVCNVTSGSQLSCDCPMCP